MGVCVGFCRQTSVAREGCWYGGKNRRWQGQWKVDWETEAQSVEIWDDDAGGKKAL